jgi:AmmeMemoRadiSam system protein B
MNIREARFSFSWYPGEPEKLKKEINRMLKCEKESIHAIGALVPHAGIIFSGEVAGKVFGRLSEYDTFIILSPNHTGMGEKISVYSSGSWKTPLGEIEVDSEIANQIVKACDLAKEDIKAHLNEHSIEIELPFLQCKFSNFKIIPITLKQISYDDCVKLAKLIASVLKKSTKNILIIASSDMSHGETLENTIKKDNLALEKFKVLDSKGLFETVRKNYISMCGYIPASILLLVSKELGANQARIISHTNSYEISGNDDYIVGYAGGIIT